MLMRQLSRVRTFTHVHSTTSTYSYSLRTYTFYKRGVQGRSSNNIVIIFFCLHFVELLIFVEVVKAREHKLLFDAAIIYGASVLADKEFLNCCCSLRGMPRTPGKKWVAVKKRLDRSHSFWHDLCRKYVQGKYSSCNAFLRSASKGFFTGCKPITTSFPFFF